jgi:hypothetical protein
MKGKPRSSHTHARLVKRYKTDSHGAAFTESLPMATTADPFLFFFSFSAAFLNLYEPIVRTTVRHMNNKVNEYLGAFLLFVQSSGLERFRWHQRSVPNDRCLIFSEVLQLVQFGGVERLHLGRGETRIIYLPYQNNDEYNPMTDDRRT